MTRQVFTRDVKLDQIKSAIAFAMSGFNEDSIAVGVGGEYSHAREWALKKWGTAGAPTEVVKAAVAGVSTGDISAGIAGLADAALFAAIRERAILYRLRGARRTGFNVRDITAGGAAAAWVEPGKAIPVHKPTFDNGGLDPAKLASLVVYTKAALELVPGIEQVVFADTVAAYVDALDRALLDPTNAGAAVAPAPLTNGSTSITSTGDPAADIASMIAAFGGNLLTSFFVTDPATAAALSALPIGRDLGARGGELSGVPTLTGAAAPAGQLALVDAAALRVAYDDDVLIESSTDGAVEMSTTPTENASTGTGSQILSIFQADLIAFRAIGRVAWKSIKADSVVYCEEIV